MLSSDFPSDRLARKRYMLREQDMRVGVLTEAGATISPGRELSRGSFLVTITISRDSMRLPNIARRAELDGLKSKMRKLGFNVRDSLSAKEFDMVVKAVDSKQAQKKASDALVKARRMNEAKDVPTVRLNARGGNAVVLAWGDDRGAKKFSNRSQADKAAATVGGKVIKPGRNFYVMIGENLDEAKKVPLIAAAKDVVDDLEQFTQVAQPKGRPIFGLKRRIVTLKSAIQKGSEVLVLAAAKNIMDDLERFNRSTQGPGRQRMASLKAAITRSILGEGFHDKHPLGAPMPTYIQISSMSGAPKPFFLDRVKEFIGRKTKRESLGKYKTREEAQVAAKKVAARTKEKIK